MLRCAVGGPGTHLVPPLITCLHLVVDGVDQLFTAEAVGQSGGQTLQSGSDRHQDESGVMPSTKMEDRRGAERCKPVIASTSDQPPTNDVGRALETMSADVEVPRETTDEAKPLGDATVVSEVFEDPRIPLTVRSADFCVRLHARKCKAFLVHFVFSFFLLNFPY